ncbi:MAG: hypothetical protein GDA50_00290 [Alphaproteobacteria bacterium GM202ARS2]|nr:hypothetical protein [Alphaproteobacteria bacterium GM202ARS2]
MVDKEQSQRDGWDTLYDSVLGVLGLACAAYALHAGYVWSGTVVGVVSLILTSFKLSGMSRQGRGSK